MSLLILLSLLEQTMYWNSPSQKLADVDPEFGTDHHAVVDLINSKKALAKSKMY